MSVPSTIRPLIVWSGTTTDDGNLAGSTIICTDLIGADDFLTNRVIIVEEGNFFISSFDNTTGVITISPPRGKQILSGTSFAISGGAGGGQVGIWISQAPVILYNAMPVGVGDALALWFDMRDIKRAMVNIISTLDQSVVIQLVGNGVQDYPSARDMGAPQNVAIGGPLPIALSAIDIGVGINDDWHPYLGVIITTAIACASGLLTITVYSQK
jgi:hypothetical protein